MTDNSNKSKYRLYYRPDGTPLYYTMEDLPGEYVSVDHVTFEAGRYDVIVKNGRIRSLSEIGLPRYRPVEIPTDTTVRCDPDDITLVVSDEPYILWDYRTDD